MKYCTWIIIIFVGNPLLFAQGNFSFSTEYGVGRSFERNAISDIPFPYTNSSVAKHYYFSPAPYKSVAVNINYETGNWIEQLGVKYGCDGYVRSWYAYYIDPSIGGLIQSPLSPQETIHYYRVSIPISLGYKIPFGRKLAFAPFVGIQINYNLDYSIDITSNTNPYALYVLQHPIWQGYSDMTIGALTKLQIRYLMSPRLYALLSPAFNWMLTSMVKVPSQTIEHSHFKLYNYSISAGLGWHLNNLGKKTKTSIK
jgi:hypothetical protein